MHSSYHPSASVQLSETFAVRDTLKRAGWGDPKTVPVPFSPKRASLGRPSSRKFVIRSYVAAASVATASVRNVLYAHAAPLRPSHAMPCYARLQFMTLLPLFPFFSDSYETCYRCMMIYEKHFNVLQYKESEFTILLYNVNGSLTPVTCPAIAVSRRRRALCPVLLLPLRRRNGGRERERFKFSIHDCAMPPFRQS